MSFPVLVLGESGTGKSDAMRDLDPTNTLLVNPLGKPIPFDNPAWQEFNPETKQGNIFATDKPSEIITYMQGTKRKVIVVDDYQYILANELMRRYQERGYDKFSEIGFNGWNIVMTAAKLAKDVRVYFLAHTTTDDSGKIKIKTPGKLLDTYSVEGMFTMVLRTMVQDGEYYFRLKNCGFDTVKCPRGMFEGETIPNDLNLVDKAICKRLGVEG